MTTLLAPAPTMEFKELRALQTKVLDAEAGTVEALVAVTGNEDDGGDVIEPGAFEFPEGRKAKIVWSHDMQVLVGKVLEAKELLPGDLALPADLKAGGLGALWFKLQFDLQDPDGFKAYRKVVFHDDLGWSIGYQADPSKIEKKDGRRHLGRVIVYEASPVTFGMNREARTLTVKSAFARMAQALPEAKRVVLSDLLDAIAADPGGDTEGKAWPPVEGSIEERQYLVRQAIEAWAVEEFGEREEGNYWYVWAEATFDDRVIASIERTGEERYWLEFPWTEEAEGIVLGDPTEVELVTTVEVQGGTMESNGKGFAPRQFRKKETKVDAKAKAHEPHDYDDDGGKCQLCGKPESNALHGEKAIDIEAGLKALLGEEKAGRVLARRNEARIRSALDSIAEVLAEVAKPDDEKDEKVESTPVEAKAADLDDLAVDALLG